jgi:hypothetical protein
MLLIRDFISTESIVSSSLSVRVPTLKLAIIAIDLLIISRICGSTSFVISVHFWARSWIVLILVSDIPKVFALCSWSTDNMSYSDILTFSFFRLAWFHWSMICETAIFSSSRPSNLASTRWLLSHRFVVTRPREDTTVHHLLTIHIYKKIFLQVYQNITKNQIYNYAISLFCFLSHIHSSISWRISAIRSVSRRSAKKKSGTHDWRTP